MTETTWMDKATPFSTLITQGLLGRLQKPLHVTPSWKKRWRFLGEVRAYISVDCYVVKLPSCVALLPRTFATFLDHSCIINEGMFTFLSWVSRFASVTEIIKYVEKLLIFACLVFSKTFLWNSIQVPNELFDELTFFPTSWSAVFSQLWRRSIFLCSPCLLCRRHVYSKIDRSLLWPLRPWHFQQILVAHLESNMA